MGTRAQYARLLEEARDFERKGADSASFSNHFFSQGGRLSRVVHSKEEWDAFVKSDVYRKIKEIDGKLRKRDIETFEAAIQAASGRLTVIVPKSLHVGLRLEAEKEGVSMAELIRVKLACPLSVSAIEPFAGKRTEKKVA